eukprot:13707465-Alexandrium_andersonii.AAC.1
MVPTVLHPERSPAHATMRQCFGIRVGQPRSSSPTLSRGAFSAVVRADSKSDVERGSSEGSEG